MMSYMYIVYTSVYVVNSCGKHRLDEPYQDIVMMRTHGSNLINNGNHVVGYWLYQTYMIVY